MNASEWKKCGAAKAAAEAEDLTLPSGMTIKARRPGPLQLALWGRLPFSLVAAVSGETAPAASAGEQAAGIAAFLRNLLLYCCVSPRISLDPKGEAEIHPSEINDEDLAFIVKWATSMEESSDLESFRGKRADDRDRGNGKDVRGAPERPLAN